MKLKALIAAPLVAVLVTALSAAPTVLPDGWLRTGSAKTCRLEAEAAPGAPTPTVFVIDCPKSTKGFATLMQMISAKDYAGKRVRLSAQVQGAGLQDWGGLWMRGDVGQQIGAAFDNMQDRPLQGDFGWRQAQVVLDIPADTDRLSFGFLLSGTGTLRATQFRLETVPGTVPVTGGASPMLPDQPRNMSPGR